MPTYARRSASQAGHETTQAARKAATRQHQTDDPAALRATTSPQAAVQARLAGLAQSSGRAAQLRALQASADARPLPAGMAAVQRIDGGEEEEMLQGRFADTVQRSTPEEEEPLQGRFGAAPVQRQATDAEEPAQMAKDTAAPDRTGLPSQLKAGIEALSGMSMDNVRVHYNSAKPAQLNALAYAQGTDIHVGPGQEQHLPHEAWHVVQQAQGRVRPTMQMKNGVPVNDDQSLEREADVMGGQALRKESSSNVPYRHVGTGDAVNAITQLMTWRQCKELNENDYSDPESLGVSGGGVWMYRLRHAQNSNYDIRVHYHAGSSKASNTWTVRWASEESGSNIRAIPWMKERVNAYYLNNQT